MKKLSLFILLIAASFPLMAQVDEYQEYLNSLKKEQEEFARQTEKNISNLQKEYQKFVTEANAEYAAFMKKEWELYENFKTQELTMTLPSNTKTSALFPRCLLSLASTWALLPTIILLEKIITS